MTECHVCEDAEATTEKAGEQVCDDCALMFEIDADTPMDPANAREVFAVRLHEAGLDDTRFIDVVDGEKKAYDHTLLHPDSDELSGNYGVYAGPGEHGGDRVLVDVDVDDYDAENDLPDALTGLPETFAVESPHTDSDGPGGHYYFSAPADALGAVKAETGSRNASLDWGELRVHNYYCVGPGSQLDGCDKDWCNECAEPDGGYYRVAEDRPIAELDAEDVVALATSEDVDDQDTAAERVSTSGSSSLDTETYQERLEKALLDSDDEKLQALWTGDYAAAGHGDDRSRAESSLANRLGWWLEADKEAVRDAMNGVDLPDSVPEPVLGKWPQKSSGYRESVLAAVDNVDEHFGTNDWGTVLWEFNNEDIPVKNARYSACQMLEEEHDFIATRREEELLMYDPNLGIYTDVAEQEVGRILEEKLEEHYNYTLKGQVVDRLKQRNWFDDDEIGGGENEICVANGILDCKTLDFEEHSPDRVFTRRVPNAWPEEGADNPAVDSFLDEVFDGDEDKKRQVYQLMGHALHPSQPKPVLAFLYGDGQNGKSLVLELIEELIGHENTASTKLHELANDAHALAQQAGKLYNYHDDLSSDRLRNTGVVKSLTGGARAEANPKGEERFRFEAEATQIFACNEPPKIEDGTHALNRRLVHIRMPVTFTPEDQPGPDQEDEQAIKDRLFTDDELAATMRRALEAYQDVHETMEWHSRGDVEENREHWERASHPIETFIEECVETTLSERDHVRKSRLFDLYEAWADEYDMPAKTRSVLGREMREELAFTNVQRARYDDGDGGTVREDRFHGVALTEDAFRLIQRQQWEQDELDVDFVDDVDGAVAGTAVEDLPFNTE